MGQTRYVLLILFGNVIDLHRDICGQCNNILKQQKILNECLAGQR